MNAIGQGIQKLEHYADAIINLLTLHNHHLEKIAQPDLPAKLSKLDVISEAQLRSFSFESNTLTPTVQTAAGEFMKINHWASECPLGGQVTRLYYGAATGNVSILDATPGEGIYVVSNPNELLVPPLNMIFVNSNKPGVITLSVTTYQLSL